MNVYLCFDRFLEKTYLIEERNHTINNDYFVSEMVVFLSKFIIFFFRIETV
jgi:hypothetical protein